MRFALLILLATLAGVAEAQPVASAPWHFIPPPGSGVANVKNYGAVGDGISDDTEAILEAISDNIDESRYRANPFIWFPNGTYLVSDSIEGRVIAEGRDEGKVWSAGWRAMLLLIGESRDGVVIRLKDRATGFGDAEKPKWLLATGSEHDNRDSQAGGGNRAFRHNILNLTIDVGNHNPGAIGIDFVASNRGSVDGVTIRSGKNSGAVGINLTRWWPGPAMIHDVLIDGFDYAFKTAHSQYGMSFENITIRNIRKVAVENPKNVLTMRNVDYVGTAPFYSGTNRQNFLALLDSSLTYKGQEAATAISSAGILDLRRVETAGFRTVVDDLSQEDSDLEATSAATFKVENQQNGPVLNTTERPSQPLNLPIAEIPTIRPPSDVNWVDGGDSSSSLQAVIDAGAEFVFLRAVAPLEFSEPVVIRNRLRLIMGMHAHVKSTTPGQPAFIMGDCTPDLVCIEHVYIEGGVEHPSDRTLVIRHADLGKAGYHATGSGMTHIVDVIGRDYRIGPDHTLWARQLNAEFGNDPLFSNSGTSCILSFKMESSSTNQEKGSTGTPAAFNQAGSLEIIGGLLYTLGSWKHHAPEVPAFTNAGGHFSASFRKNGKPATHYPVILRQGTLLEGTDYEGRTIEGPGAALVLDGHLR
ncbi:MAG: glycosyl hydrolase family 28-related protein [Verrucomicrobiota bacterium]